jgi:NAD(P)-dependent dehydrogenase (short-subunit alcohol dehydrogenase family)
MNDALKNRHVVITGGTGGLGRAVVNAFLQVGTVCHLPLHGDAPHDAGMERSERLVYAPKVDLTDEAAVTGFYESLPALWASVHLAGGFSMRPIAETRLEEFRAQFDLNAVTCFLCCREAVRAIRNGNGFELPGGRIVNVAARPVVAPEGGMIAYSASKAAVASITQSLAIEVKSEGILVNAVLPSIIDTSANREAMPKADPAKWPKPEQIAETILFLCSPENALTSGALIPVYGRA